MLRNSVNRIWNSLTLDNESKPEYKKISNLNKNVHLIKEMDSAKNKVEIDQAITQLKQWQEMRQHENDSLLLDELKEKQKVLIEASTRFNSRFYLMMTCIVANAATMSSAMCAAFASDLSIGEKSLTIGVAGVGIVEGSIHLYKAKRFFAQKYQITQIELDSVNTAIANKIHSHRL